MNRALALAVVVASICANVCLAAEPASRADFVSPRCSVAANAPACRVALRYLAALDLDRAGEACRLLSRPTLEAAGGMAGCKRTLLKAKGIRIRYSIDGVWRSQLGTTVRFTTHVRGRVHLRQQMLVSRAARVIAVVPEL